MFITLLSVMFIPCIHTGCRCPKCWSEASGQYLTPPEDLLGSYTLNDVQVDGDHLRVSWAEDVDTEHLGLHPLNWLKENAYGEVVLTKRAAAARPKVLESGKLSVFDYKDILSCEEARLEWLIKIYQDGCSMLRGVPCESGTVMKVADHIYKVQHTCYGDMWDIVPSKEPTNVAFNESYLPLHADLIFYESAPGIQLLHCLKRDECVNGGESVLVDAMFAAEEFRRQHPVEFATLTKVAVTSLRIRYGWKSPVHYGYQRPIISLGYNDEVVSVHWSTPGEGPPCLPHEQVEDYYQARWMWASFLKNFPLSQTFTLLPGDLVACNNHRMLHSRKDFHLNGGERHLQGCYVNIDDFKSAVIAQCKRQDRPLSPCRQGNGDFVQ